LHYIRDEFSLQEHFADEKLTHRPRASEGNPAKPEGQEAQFTAVAEEAAARSLRGESKAGEVQMQERVQTIGNQ